jgi:acetate---CoA ligase (ADP-forming)
MLEARSVAVVGASARPGSFGEQLMVQLARGGFDGDVYPVNPSYSEVMGRACVPSIEDLPKPVDLVVLGVGNALLEEQLGAAAEAGARSAVIFASCYEAPEPGRIPLRDRLAALARDAGMVVCGGNGMGFVNVDGGLRACGFTEPDDIGPGPVTLITHSGSVFSALLHNDRRIRFNLAVSPGLELTTTVTDYLRYALDLPTTGVVALFIETVRDPDAFREALAEAERRDVPVVVLKVGREEQARQLVLAHSGALAGEDAAYQAVFDAYGALRVRSLDEMADTLELLAAERRAGQGGLAVMHDSGGERAHLIDAAAEVGVRFAEISEETTERLAATLEEGLPPVNPLDAWGTGRDHEGIYRTCGLALLEDPDTAALAFAVDLTTQDSPEGGYLEVARDVFGVTEKPFAVLSNLRSAVDRRDAGELRRAGIPVLEGTFTGLQAFQHLFAYRDHRSRPAPDETAGPGPEVAARWRDRLLRPPSISEVEGLAMLGDYGIPAVSAAASASLEESLVAAELIGWPVVLKTATPGVAHKSDVGGVRLGIGGPDELGRAYLDLCGRLGPEVTVQAMAPSGVELALGIVRDDQFGPLVMVAAGGVLVEVLGDRRFALCPVDERGASRLLDQLGVRPLLDGRRNAPAADVQAVARAVAALSVLGRDLGDRLGAIDVNPLIAGADGCVAADVLVVARGASPEVG